LPFRYMHGNLNEHSQHLRQRQGNNFETL
jgi:hypothetical protein